MKNYYARGRVGTDSIHYVGFTLEVMLRKIKDFMDTKSIQEVRCIVQKI